MQRLIFILFILAILYAIYFLRKKRIPITDSVPVDLIPLLETYVPFYNQLPAPARADFGDRATTFLRQVKITGVKTFVEDIDRALIAASAIIPIFNFAGWEYRNLHEVLLYPGSFDHDYEQEGEGRNILGMVGSGAMNRVMILSQFELRRAFINKTGKRNTAIHEFVHLVDKTDGEIDGIPEFLLDKKYMVPWLQLMQQEIRDIYNEESDINPYGATNQAEFFAVVSEYFFKQPDLLKEKHPELFDMLERIFAAKTRV